MLKNIYLVANFSEIFLKDGNVEFFEKKLYKNFCEKVENLSEKIIFEKKKWRVFFY